jgi:hypothetical protein
MNNKNFTPKQIQKYKRQKFLSALNKCTRNLYNIFKNPKSDYETFKNRFISLKNEMQKFEDALITADHTKKAKEYINKLYKDYIIEKELTQEEFNKLKEREISNLNRLQKMKNKVKYSKNKYNDLEF